MLSKRRLQEFEYHSPIRLSGIAEGCWSPSDTNSIEETLWLMATYWIIEHVSQAEASLISCASNDDHQLVSIVAQMTWNIKPREREKLRAASSASASPKHLSSSIQLPRQKKTKVELFNCKSNNGTTFTTKGMELISVGTLFFNWYGIVS